MAKTLKLMHNLCKITQKRYLYTEIETSAGRQQTILCHRDITAYLYQNIVTDNAIM